MKYFAIIKKFITRKNLSSSILELEGLRFFSILLVFMQHLSERVLRYGNFNFAEESVNHKFSFFLSRGTIGVFIFFAISGYVLTLPWINEKNSLRKNYKSFIFRRFTRIEPPYLIWMSIFFIILLFNSNLEFIELIKHYLCSIFYTHNIVYQNYSTINPVAWSLEVELQFYLLAPFLIKLLWSIKNINYRMLVIVALIIIIQFIQYHFGWWKFPYKITLLGSLPHFLTGILMVNVISLKAIKVNKSVIYDFTFIISWILLSYLWSTELVKNILFNSILAVLFFSAFNSIYINRFLKFGLIVIIGGMCYSIYLTHLPILEFIFQKVLIYFPTKNYLFYFGNALILTIIIASIVGILSFLFIEKPFMKYSESIIPYLKGKINSIKFNITNKKIIIPLLCFVFFSNKLYSQENEINYKIKLLPIEQIIDSAILNSPAILKQKSKQEIIRQQIKLNYKSWLNHVAITGNSLYGTGSILDNQSTATSQIVSFQNSSSVNYSIGVSMRIPLSSFLNSSNEKKILLEQSKIVDYENMESTKMLVNEISLKYFTLLNYLSQAEIASESMEANQMKLEVSEKFFKSGKTDIGLYKTDLDNYYMSKSKYLDIINRCTQELFQLRKIVGAEVINNKLN